MSLRKPCGEAACSYREEQEGEARKSRQKFFGSLVAKDFMSIFISFTLNLIALEVGTALFSLQIEKQDSTSV